MSSWYLLLITPLLAYIPPRVGSLSFYPIYLLIPYAALLGRRFGLAGVISVAIGGLAFVLSIRLGDLGRAGGSPAVYLLALLVSVLASSDRPVAEWLRWPSDKAVRWLAFAAPFLLVTTLGVNQITPSQPFNESVLGFSFGPSLLGYFLLFHAGVRGVARRPWIFGLVIVLILTWALAMSGLQGRPRSILYLWVGALQLPTMVTAVMAYAVGTIVAATLRGEPLAGVWKRPRLWIIGLLFVSQGPWTASSIGLPSSRLPGLDLLGAPAMLLLAGLFAGLVLGKRGVSFAFGAGWFVTVFDWIVDGVSGQGANALLRLEMPFVAGAYAWLGAQMAQPQSTPGKAFRIPSLVVLLLAAVGSVVDESDSPVRLVLAIMLLLAGIAVWFVRWRLGRRLTDAGLDLDADHWFSFGTLALLLVILLANWKAYGGELLKIPMLLLQLADRQNEWMGSSLLLALIALSIAALVPATRDVLRLLRSIPAVVDDLRRFYARRSAKSDSST